MKAKGWLGADLVFDLDADHLGDIKWLGFPEMLSRVKDEYKKLLDFMTEDFGFTEEELDSLFQKAVFREVLRALNSLPFCKIE